MQHPWEALETHKELDRYIFDHRITTPLTWVIWSIDRKKRWLTRSYGKGHRRDRYA